MNAGVILLLKAAGALLLTAVVVGCLLYAVDRIQRRRG